MKRKPLRFVSLLLVPLMLLSLVGCGQKTKEMDADTLMHTLLTEVEYSTELTGTGDNGVMYFPELPETSQVTRYAGSGYYADELTLISYANEADREVVLRAIERHVKELHDQFVSYIPEEVDKIDHAVIYPSGNYAVLCITNDYETAQKLLSGVTIQLPGAVPDQTGEATEDASAAPETTEAPTEVPTEEPTTAPVQTEPPAPAIPTLQSQSGTYHSYASGIIRVDNRAFEEYGYDTSAAEMYTGLVNRVAETLGDNATVYAMIIPTAIGVVLPDDIVGQLPYYSDQHEATEKVAAMLSDSVVPVKCYDNMIMHRDEYLYFRSDFHWNGRGAYYGYESFCNAKNIAPIPMEERELKQFEGFLGGTYQDGCEGDSAISNTPDTVEAFYPKSQNVSMVFTDVDGNEMAWKVITDVSDWNSGTKYNAFAGGDNPITVYQNPDVTDGSTCVIVKESFGNALIPYLVDHYSTVYEIDYRYWEGDLASFALEKGADDVIFANNLAMIGTHYLIGLLAEIIH